MEKFDNEHTYPLIISAQSGDMNAKNQICSENMRLVYNIAKRFYKKGYDDDEINQVGALGLWRAIENFDTKKNVRFSTYAVPIILGEIKRFLRDNGPVKVSRATKQTAAEILKFTESVQKAQARTPDVAEIAAALNITSEDVVFARESLIPPKSFFSKIDGENLTLSDTLADVPQENNTLLRLDLSKAIQSLSEREQQIIAMRFIKEKTQTEIAKKLGISQVQVSRIEKSILQKLMEKLRA